MKRKRCTKLSEIIHRLQLMDKAIENGKFEAALGLRVTVIDVEIFHRPNCIIKRPKKG
jgi:hypothetical protein